MLVAEGHHLVALQLLVPVEADGVAALLGRCRGVIAMDDGGIKPLVLVKFQHRALKDWRRCSHRPPTAATRYRCGCGGSPDGLRHPCRSAASSNCGPYRAAAEKS